MLLTRGEDSSISTSLFCKATHMDQYLAYEYYHPTAHMMAVVRTLFFSGVTRAQDEERVQQSLWKNGYPAAFISRHSLPQPVQQSEEQAARVTVTIPYIHGLSQSIRRVLSHLDIIFTFQPFLILNQDSVKATVVDTYLHA